jgi:hypothetical protein
MFHRTIQVQGGLKQDPQVFESLHTLNNVKLFSFLISF